MRRPVQHCDAVKLQSRVRRHIHPIWRARSASSRRFARRRHDGLQRHGHNLHGRWRSECRSPVVIAPATRGRAHDKCAWPWANCSAAGVVLALRRRHGFRLKSTSCSICSRCSDKLLSTARPWSSNRVIIRRCMRLYQLVLRGKAELRDLYLRGMGHERVLLHRDAAARLSNVIVVRSVAYS